MKSFSNVRYLAMKSLARVGRLVCVRDILATTQNSLLRDLWIEDMWVARIFLTELKIAMHFFFVMGYSPQNARVWYLIRSAFRNSGFQLRVLHRASTNSMIRFVPELSPFLSSLFPRRLIAHSVNAYPTQMHYHDAVLRCARICSLVNEITFGGFFLAGDAYTLDSLEEARTQANARKRTDVLTCCTHAPLVIACIMPILVKSSVVYITISNALLR
jgi:hypothetical protein